MLKFLKQTAMIVFGGLFFLTVFAFALNNREPVMVHWMFGYTSRLQLVLLLFWTFVLGAVFGVLALLPRWWRGHRAGILIPEQRLDIAQPQELKGGQRNAD